MNICFFTNNYSFTGGIERVLSLISSELSKTNRVSVVSIYDIPSKNMNKNNYPNDVKINILFKGKKKYIEHLVPTIKRLREFLINNNIDVVIATSEFVAPYCYFACKKTNIKHIAWTHTPALNFDESIIQKPIKKFAFKKMNYVFTLTPESKGNIVKYYGKKEVFDIPNPIDPKLLNYDNTYKYQSNKIITVGRLCGQKNIEEAIEVANIVLKKNSTWSWDVYGDGDEVYKNQLFERIRKYHLTDKFNIKGNVDNLYQKYNDYSFLVMTSRYEGFPMALLEGAANKLPLVSYNISTGPNLLISNNVNGYLIEPFNTQDMASKIQLLINEVKIREKMSKESNKMISKYKIDNVVDIWNRALNEVVNSEE